MTVDLDRDHLQRLLVTIIFAIVCVITDSQEDRHVCLTPECQEISRTILSSMDIGVDPCEDMYQYACGGWLKNLNLSPEMRKYNIFTHVDDDNEIQTLQNLNNSNFTIKGRQSEAILKAQTLYQNCMDEETIYKNGVKDLVKIINRLGSWTVVLCGVFEPWQRMESSFSKTVTAIHKVFPMSSFWVFGAASSFKDTNKTIIFFRQGHLTYEVRDYSDMHEALEYNYLQFATDIGEMFGGIYEIIQDKMKKVLALEKRLAQISVKYIADIELSEMKFIKFSDFQALFKDLINWEDYFSQLFSRNFLSGDDEILLQTPEYFEKLADILRQTDNEVLTNFMIWMTIQKSLLFLPKILLEVAEYFYIPLKDVSSSVPRQKYCFSITNNIMASITFAMFVEKDYTQSTGDEVTSMLLEIKHQFLLNLNNVTWLDDETRAAIRDKAESMGMFVGHPDWMGDAAKLDERYKDLQIKQGNFFDNHLQLSKYNLILISQIYDDKLDINEWPFLKAKANAHYFSDKNAMVFPAMILKFPIYSKKYPKPYNYGGFGSICGHELTHGFDSDGRKFTKFGASSEIWWTNSSIENFKNKSACFVDFFGAYELHGTKFNSHVTLGENIADSGGLRLAYKAFKASQRDNDFTLPGINLTTDQIFFLGFSQLYCSYISKEDQISEIKNSRHTIKSHRVLGALSNSREFAEAYGCKANSTMNPSKKCEVW